jgi:hypothetical protein
MVEAALRSQLKTGESGQLPLPMKSTQSGRVAMPKRSRAGLLPRWVIVVPIAGALLVVVAIIAGTSRDGGVLANAWYGPRLRDAAPIDALTRLADALGPIAVVAVVGGLAVLARIHLASLAILACALGAVLVDLRTGAPGAATLGLAALCAGAAVARLAGTIRIRSGQAIAAATFGLILLTPPVWTVIG